MSWRPHCILSLAFLLSGLLCACAHDFGGGDELATASAALRVDDVGELWLEIRVDGWPETDFVPPIRIESSGLEVTAGLAWHFMDRALRYRVPGARAEGRILLRAQDEGASFADFPLVGGGRARLQLPVELDVADAHPLPAAAAAPEPSALGAALVEGCGCHFEPERGLRSLELAELRWARSRRDPTRYLVEPAAPERSLLLHVLLEDYPRRGGIAMPPPWAEAPLSGQALATLAEDIARWIEVGAPLEP